MAASKQVHMLTQTFNVTHPNDPLTGDFIPRQTNYLRLDQMVSRNIGKNVRQGSNFRVVGIGCTLTGSLDGPAGADLDEGGAAMVKFDWVQPTKEKVKAWQRVKKRWLKWRRLAGVMNRFDDFCVCFDPNHHGSGDYWGGSGSGNQPFSEIFDSENMLVGDFSDRHNVGLLGDTQDVGAGVDFTGAFAEYESRMGYTFVSTDAEGNVLARAKFSNKPAQVTDGISVSCNLTPVGDEGDADEGSPYGIGYAMEWLPADNHCSVMCGLIRVNAWILPLDETIDYADNLTLSVTIAVEGWSELK